MNTIIAALATPPGIGGISVIRISGANSLEIVLPFLRFKRNKVKVKPGRIYYCDFFVDVELVDEIMIAYFEEYRSYTGEETLEISCHGSPVIVSKILEALYNTNKIHRAGPGEFTERRFMNGKIDLVQAEAVINLINSESDLSSKTSLNQLKGVLSDELGSIKKQITGLLSTLELELDFSEEDIEFTPKSEIESHFDALLSVLYKFLNSYKTGKIYRDGIKIVLTGKVNAGKSSLMNRLLKENRAIVTSIEGTTRDVIEERLNVKGYLLRIFDTAGLRETEDIIELEGIKRSKELIDDSDLILNLIDSTNFDNNLILDNPKAINVLNKCDMANVNLSYLKISCKTGDGVEELKDEIIRKIEKDYIQSGSAFLTSKRHEEIVIRAISSVKRAKDTLYQGYSNEVIIPELRDALDILGELTGETTSLDIINNIFANFCIGK
ncbi:MAG: tRNA uridine-5-carboxymethylaminomethyl(34) synthesis GTPase MnmE [Candidatus Delongbacteria bacterium]|nr:tRNA uridine-5-carboxymethylaminomethyl(34) synthesis GTPase MnmE [Candidatus Delongbacteria bacterium]MBN2836273.1 tRNA uridine-5-carboxymethylaminomethyl(34) synthesis GTPase MnmE [Candidatus Delongbacteria bacterium]